MANSEQLQMTINEVGFVIHIAAWHGIHEELQLRTRDEFWDLNVTGTQRVCEAIINSSAKPKFIFISSTSVSNPISYYAFSKRQAESIVKYYAERFKLDVITLRPRAFIPASNRKIYNDHLDWTGSSFFNSIHHPLDRKQKRLVCCLAK